MAILIRERVELSPRHLRSIRRGLKIIFANALGGRNLELEDSLAKEYGAKAAEQATRPIDVPRLAIQIAIDDLQVSPEQVKRLGGANGILGSG